MHELSVAEALLNTIDPVAEGTWRRADPSAYCGRASRWNRPGGAGLCVADGACVVGKPAPAAMPPGSGDASSGVSLHGVWEKDIVGKTGNELSGLRRRKSAAAGRTVN